MVIIRRESCYSHGCTVRNISTASGHCRSGQVIQRPVHLWFCGPVCIGNGVGNRTVVRTTTGWAVVSCDFHRVSDDVIDIDITLTNTSHGISNIEGVGATRYQVREGVG